MIGSTPSARRITRPFEVGELVAKGRGRQSQEAFAAAIGISRQTLSKLELGEAENMSFETVLKALAKAGFVVEVREHRKPTINEVLSNRAEELSQRGRTADAKASR